MKPYPRMALRQKPEALAKDLQYTKTNVMSLAVTANAAGEKDTAADLDQMAGELGRIQDRLRQISEQYGEERHEPV